MSGAAVSGAAVVAGLAGAIAGVALVELAVLASRRRRLRSSRAVAVGLLARLGRRVGAPAAPRDLAARLAAAGRPLGLRVGDVMAIKGGAAVLGVALTLPLGALLPGRLPLVVPLVLPLGGFVAPDLWLRRRARARGREIEAELPDLLDLLRVALGAGLPLERAVGDVADRATGLLAREWRTVAVEIGLGVPRDEALAALAARCPTPGVGALVRTLRRAARHGAPPGEALEAQAREARATRARRLDEQAARAAPKIQLVVALLLVPSVLLLVGAALLASFAG